MPGRALGEAMAYARLRHRHLSGAKASSAAGAARDRPLRDDATDERGTVDDEEQAIGGIEVPADADRSVVRLWGEVDATLRDQASVAMVELIRRRGPYIVDVADLRFIDSAGIAFVLQLNRVAIEDGSTMTLLDPPGVVTDMLELIGIGGSIPCAFSHGDDGAVGLPPAGA